jgi:hypothetical protein
MKNTLKLLPVIALFVVNSCSFANKSTVTVPINSNPPGADVVIDGKNYGQTPLFASLNPGKNHKATISKKGYGSASIDMDTWYSMRDGEGDDGKRCMADIGSFLFPYFVVLLFAPEKCASFKQADYFVDLAGGKQITPEDSNPQNNNQSQGQTNNGNYYGNGHYQQQGQAQYYGGQTNGQSNR